MTRACINESKGKGSVYSPDIRSRFSRLYIIYPQVLELTLSQSHLQFAAAVAIHTVPIFVLLGTHYWWVDSTLYLALLTNHSIQHGKKNEHIRQIHVF